MLRPMTILAALLAASPAAALSVSNTSCNAETASLVTDEAGTRLTVNGADVPLEEGAEYGNLVCTSRDGVTQFGLVRTTAEAETYLLLDPATLEWTEVSEEEAAGLDFFDSEDDWGLGTDLLD